MEPLLADNSHDLQPFCLANHSINANTEKQGRRFILPKRTKKEVTRKESMKRVAQSSSGRLCHEAIDESSFSNLSPDKANGSA